MTKSIRTSNARFARQISWSLGHPTYREGLEQVVAAWSRGHNASQPRGESVAEKV